MKAKHLRFLFSVAVLGYWISPASATLLYTNDFSADDSASWTQNKAPTASAAFQQAQFAFDYSVFGIPAAPGSSDTKGLRLRANLPIVSGNEVTTRPAGTTSGLSVSPTGKNFGNSYTVQFYAWSNFNAAPNAQGLADNANSEGGTNNVMFALGTSGTVPLVVGNTGLVTNGNMDAIGFATTGDGGIANDYRAYKKSGTFEAPGTGVYAAGTGATANQNANTYYTTTVGTLGPKTAPAIQQTLSTAEFGGDAFNTQAGSTQAGSFGFAWHKVTLDKNGNSVKWFIDDKIIATVDVTSVVLGGNNFGLGVSDVNATTTRHPSLLFTVFDGLQVFNAIPEPSSGMVVGLILATIGLLPNQKGRTRSSVLRWLAS